MKNQRKESYWDVPVLACLGAPFRAKTWTDEVREEVSPDWIDGIKGWSEVASCCYSCLPTFSFFSSSSPESKLKKQIFEVEQYIDQQQAYIDDTRERILRLDTRILEIEQRLAQDRVNSADNMSVTTYLDKPRDILASREQATRQQLHQRRPSSDVMIDVGSATTDSDSETQSALTVNSSQSFDALAKRYQQLCQAYDDLTQTAKDLHEQCEQRLQCFNDLLSIEDTQIAEKQLINYLKR